MTNGVVHIRVVDDRGREILGFQEEMRRIEMEIEAIIERSRELLAGEFSDHERLSNDQTFLELGELLRHEN